MPNPVILEKNCENAKFVASAKYTSLENLYEYGNISVIHYNKIIKMVFFVYCMLKQHIYVIKCQINFSFHFTEMKNYCCL